MNDESQPAAGRGAPASEAPRHLSLFEALKLWCDPVLVARIHDEERKLIPYELHQFPMPKLLPEAEWGKPRSGSWGSTDYVFLTAAWNDLTHDFRRRIEVGELYLEGVLSGDDPEAQPETIPNIWAAELKFDLNANVVVRGSRTYLAVTVSRTPSPWTAVGPSREAELHSHRRLSQDAVAALDDDEVLALLEEHARRVIASPDAALIAPGKISLIPIVKGKMEYRAAHGELLPTLAEEATVLSDWIGSKVSLHQTPSAATISKVLSKTYAALKARSNAAIQRPKN
jgi:hypothetical protein